MLQIPFKSILPGILLLVSFIPVNSQTKDSNIVAPNIQGHSPQKAVKYSTICPGLGQVYNKKFWKIPIIYGAGTAMVYGVIYNQAKFKKFREAVFNKDLKAEKIRIDGIYYEKRIIFTAMRYFERNRDKCLLGVGAIYLLNIIDAMVDAYFFSFDISDDLSMQIKPSLIQSPEISPSLGFGINIQF
jgi:hypothetical protein